MSKTKEIVLETPITWAGVNYEPGAVTMPDEAADYAIKRQFGTAADGRAPAADLPEDFTPLSFEETFKRFDDGDSSLQVFDSMRFYQPKIKPAREARLSVEEYIEREKEAAGGAGEEKGLPEDFPMRHVFEKLGADFDSVEKIQATSLENLIALDGIGEASAKKALAYGK